MSDLSVVVRERGLQKGLTKSQGVMIGLGGAGHLQDLLVPSTFEAIEALRDRSSRLGCSAPAAALRFILDMPGVSSLIIAPRSIAQFDNYGVEAGG